MGANDADSDCRIRLHKVLQQDESHNRKRAGKGVGRREEGQRVRTIPALIPGSGFAEPCLGQQHEDFQDQVLFVGFSLLEISVLANDNKRRCVRQSSSR